MKVMHFSNYSAPYEGNFILSLKALEAVLNGQGIQMVYVFTKEAKEQPWAKELLQQGKTVYFLQDGLFSNIFLFATLIRRHRIRLVHTHFSVFKFDLMLKVARLFARKTVCVRHMHMFYRSKQNKVVERVKRLISNADVEITCSDAVYQAMQQAGFSTKNMVNVTNAVDFSRLDAAEPVDFDAFDIPRGKKIVLMFGYGYDVKGVDVAVKAVTHLNDNGGNIVLCIVAAAYEDDVRERLANEFGTAAENVRFLPPRNDIASYYQLADVFLSASRSEGLSYALIEAKYCNTLTVASDIPGNIRTDDEFLFESENHLALAEKLCYALGIDNEKKESVLQKEHRFVTEQFGLDQWSEKIAAVYRHVLP